MYAGRKDPKPQNDNDGLADVVVDNVQKASLLARDETTIYVQNERVGSKEVKSWIERKKCLEERCDVQLGAHESK